MKRKFIQLFAGAVVALWATAASISNAVAQADNQKTAGGITVYLGVLPAAMIQGHPKDHPEGTMHGAVPRGRDAYHVMAALFDATNGDRIETATVEGRVTPLGLSGVTHTLEPMQIAGTVTYGNYFTIRANEPYRILISVIRDRETKPVTLEFSHEHRTR